MSIKLYNGIKFEETDFRRLHRQLIAGGVGLRKVVAEKIRYEILMDATRRFDRALLADAPMKDVLYEATAAFRDEAEKCNRSSGRSSFDYSFKVTVVPHGDAIYGLHHGRGDLLSELEVRVPFQDYHYQNQTDPPDDVTEADWEQRACVWGEVFKDSPSWVACEVGPEYALVPETPEYDYGSAEDFERSMPMVNGRRFPAIARQRLFDRAVIGELPESGIRPDAMRTAASEMMRINKEFRDWLATSAGEAAYNRELAALAARLPERIDYAMLKAARANPPG